MATTLSQRIWKETTDMFKSEDGKNIFELMKEETDKRTNASMMNSRIAAAVYFWIVAITAPWIFITEIIPNEFRDSSEEKVYWMKVLIIVLSLQCMANWLCCRLRQVFRGKGRRVYRNVTIKQVKYENLSSKIYKFGTLPHIDCSDLFPHASSLLRNKLTSTHVVGTRDRPAVDKTLWDGDDTMYGDSTKDSGYCKICKMVAPYGSKTHHCKICERCILRRDHHCYLLGTCVGYYNQRYFAILMFYMAISSWMCFVYFRRHLLSLAAVREDFYWTEHILPLTIKHLIFGRIAWMEFFLLLFCYTFVWTGCMGSAMFSGQMALMYTGLTYHEFKNKKKSPSYRTIFENFREVFGVGFFCLQMYITFTGQTWHESKMGASIRTYRTASENFREIYGPCWLTNFILPMSLAFKQREIELPVLLVLPEERTIPVENGSTHVYVDM